MAKRGMQDGKSGEVYLCELSLDRWELVRVGLEHMQSLPGAGVTRELQFVRSMATDTLADIAAQVPERGEE